jgi:hypothetical protein
MGWAVPGLLLVLLLLLLLLLVLLRAAAPVWCNLNACSHAVVELTPSRHIRGCSSTCMLQERDIRPSTYSQQTIPSALQYITPAAAPPPALRKKTNIWRGTYSQRTIPLANA